MKRLLMAAALLLAAAGPAQAEKADMYKTTDIAFGALKMDDVKQVTVLSEPLMILYDARVGGVLVADWTLPITSICCSVVNASVYWALVGS